MKKGSVMYQGTDTDEAFIASHLPLRRVLGILGVVLPIVLLLWELSLGDGIRDSISSYYNLGTEARKCVETLQLRPRDAFVGILFAIAWFLWTYEVLFVETTLPVILHVCSHWVWHSFPTNPGELGAAQCTWHRRLACF